MYKPILTLTVNPALDRIVSVDRLVFEDRGYIESTTEAAGGRGINAARVLTSLGAQVVAITTAGREIGRRFEEQLQHDTFDKEIVKIRSEIRTNLTISDRQGLSIKLNERGPALSPPEQRRIIEATGEVAARLLLAYAVRQPSTGMDLHFYTKLLTLANKHKVEDAARYRWRSAAARSGRTSDDREAQSVGSRALIEHWR